MKLKKIDASPSRIRLICKETWRRTKRAQLPLVASSLSYTTILSLIPLLAVSFAIFQVFGGFDKFYGSIESFILDNLAEGASDQVIEAIGRFISNAHPKTVGVGGLLGLIFTSLMALSSIERAINSVWSAPLKRSWLRRISSYWIFITLGPVALAVGIGAATSSAFPIAKFFPSGTGIFVILVALFFFVYKWVPHTNVTSRYAFASATLASISLTIARIAYQAYIAKAVSYNRIYGSLAAIPILLLWIYIVWLIILGGAALTATLQNMKQASMEIS